MKKLIVIIFLSVIVCHGNAQQNLKNDSLNFKKITYNAGLEGGLGFISDQGYEKIIKKCIDLSIKSNSYKRNEGSMGILGIRIGYRF